MKRAINTLWKNIVDKVKENQAIQAVLTAIIVIIFIFLILVILETLNAPSRYYSIIFGIIFGLLCGYLLQTKISQTFKFGTVGIFGGMGLDLLANNISQEKTHKTVTAINSLGGMITNIVNNSFSDGAVESLEKDITRGLWVSILVIALVLICAQFFRTRVEGEKELKVEN